MGLSMGGMIVQAMAIEHPERADHDDIGDVLDRRARLSARARHARSSSSRLPRPRTASSTCSRAIDGLHEWGSPEFADEARWRANAEAAFDRCFHPSGPGRQFFAVGASGSRAEALTKVTVPTLVIHGDKDTLIDQVGGRRTAELIPGARFELIEGMGHDYPPELWERVKLAPTSCTTTCGANSTRPGHDARRFRRTCSGPRRTSMLVDNDRPVPHDLVEAPLRAWPSGHRTTSAPGPGGSRWSRATAGRARQPGRRRDGGTDDPPEKVAKARTKYLRTPAMLVVGAAPGDSPLRTAENRDAAAAGMQNLLFAATTDRVGDLLELVPEGRQRRRVELCGFESGSYVVAIIYLGWATEQAATPDRPPVTLRLVD